MASTYEKIGELSALYYYPVKSCGSIEVTQGQCHEFGLEYDRRWAILDRGGKVIGLSSRPELALVMPEIRNDTLTLEAPGMEPLCLPIVDDAAKGNGTEVDVSFRGLDGSGRRVSDEADAWFSNYLGKPHTLIVFNASCKPRFLHLHKKFGRIPQVKETDKVAFAENSPFLLIPEESVEALDEKCTKFKSDMLRFRPNIVIKGATAFAEDSWSFVKIGDIEFRCLKKCGRCTVPNVDPATAVKDKEEPLKTLKEFRQVSPDEEEIYGKAPILGRNLATVKGGVIKLGDIVYAK